MICKKCGELLDDNARVCPVCGARQRGSSGSVLNPTHSESADCAHDGSRRKKRPAAHRENLSGLLILIGVLLILCGPTLLLTLAGNWGSPRMFLLAGAVIAGVILVRIGLTLYKRK